jgi:serine/threonine-protein kinase
LRLFGGLDLSGHDARAAQTAVRQPKRTALLVYLAIARPRGFHRRDRLLSLFWPELDDQHARDALNSALRFLRKSLGADVIVSRGVEEVGVSPEHLWCDVLAFESALEAGDLDAALALYDGDLLDGFHVSDASGFEEWLESERPYLRERAARAARDAAEQHEASQDLTMAIRFARRGVVLSDRDERMLRRLIGLLDRLGDRAGAIEAYEEFASWLAVEYETEPSAETKTLMAQVRARPARAAVGTAPVAVEPAPVHPSDSAAHSPPGSLERLRASLATRYAIDREIARGGTAIVYLALDLKHQRRVALKVIRPEIAATVGSERFLHEIRVAASLHHPHIVPLFDSGETEGLLYSVMPFVEGESLRERLDRERQLPVAESLRIARDVALALDYAHRQGVVHRDIKPQNILMSSGEALVTDFGIARAITAATADDGSGHLTEAGIAIGTPAYMSPEQASGEHEVDGRSDIYSLGCVLFEMLAGEPPFTGTTPRLTLARHATSQPRSLFSLRPDVGVHTDGVVARALAKVPSERFASAGELAEALVAHAPSAGQAGTTPSLRFPSVSNHIGAGAESDGPAIRVAIPERPPWWPRRATLVRASLQLHGRVVVASIAVLSALVAGTWLTRDRPGSPVMRRAVAVLPFRDLDERGYLATGLSDAISNDLQRIKSLAVPGYSSTSAHRSTNRPLQDVAAELDVGAVVTGSVWRIGDRVRIDVELSEVEDDRAIWSRQYQVRITEVHDIQRRITRGIVDALRAELDSAERAALSRPVTSNGRAFDLYLRGREIELRAAPLMSMYGRRLTIEEIQEAQSLFARARALDPRFALARARLARMLIRAAFRYDTTQVRRDQARLEAEIALRLSPGLPEAHTALAEYWLMDGRNVPKAIEQLQLAVAASPNHADSRMFLGTLYRDAGRWDEALEQYERAMQLEPRDVRAPTQAAFTLSRMRRDEEAIRAFNRAIELDPDAHMLKLIKGHTYLRWKGISDTLAAVLRSVPADWDPDGMTTWARYTVLRVERRDREALAMLAASRSKLSRDGLVYQPTALMRAQSYEALGERAQARAHYEAALAVLRDSLANPRDASARVASARVALALAYAGLGRKPEAIREARRAIDQVPLSSINPSTTAIMGVAVEVFGRVGELDEALKLLELLLGMPAGREVTIPFLRVWPGFDPLRSDPRFDQLLERFATE